SSGSYTTPTLTSSMGSHGNTYCSSTQGTQIDNFALSRLNGIQLRLDALGSGISDLMTDASNAQQNAASTPPVYQFAAYTMDSSWQIGMTSSNNYNQLMALTTNYVSAWTAAAPNFGVLQYYSNDNGCGNASCSTGGGSHDVATNYTNALGAMNSIMPNPGNGTNIAGDTPQDVMFFVTDGVADEVNATCSQPLASGNRCQEPIDTTLCTTIKNRGIRIAILYTDYYPVTANSWYEGWIAPFQPTIASSLQSCASPNLFYEASIGADLGSALQMLFNTVTQTAHLTN
ncbi:MAG: hypothetical protein JO107_10005, partial [Hyphomicrobiales bacterium]|nr:hypothetical protein [Hyphomicrobiales bacterium]